jgi:hypothetical protein
MFEVDPTVLAGIVARPETFVSAYDALGGPDPAAYVRSQMGASFTTLSAEGCISSYATSVAYSASATGATALDPMTTTLQQLLAAPVLTSAHRCKLAALLAFLGSPGLAPPDAPSGSTPKPTAHVLVWLASVPLNTGALSQLVLANVLDSAYLLVDPTYSFALRIPYAGAGPQADLSVVENSAIMLQTVISADNIAVFDAAATAALPQFLPTLTGGTLGPQFLDVSSSDGSDNWDTMLAQVFENMG